MEFDILNDILQHSVSKLFSPNIFKIDPLNQQKCNFLQKIFSFFFKLKIHK